LSGTFSYTGRFAEMKERYSSRFGQAIANPDLDPERAKNWTLGYSHAFASKIIIRAELFRSDVSDALENILVYSANNACPNSGLDHYCKQWVNVGNEVREGAELAVHSTLVSRITLDANYDFLNRSIGSPNPPNAASAMVYATGTPKHKAVGTATARLPKGITAIATARYESGTLFQFDGSTLPAMPASQFATLDLGVIWSCNSRLSVQAGINNVSDHYYYYQEGYPEPGRNWFLAIRHRF
jgi:iron complex outermembrane recepter protein